MSAYARLTESSMGLKASSLFLNRKIVPKPFKDRRASLFVFLLTSIRAVKKSVKIRFTCSLVELVTRDSAANETRAYSPLDVFYFKIKSTH